MGNTYYPEQSKATTVLVLGILGIVICSVLAPIAWYLGNEEVRAIDAGRRDPTNRGTANAGRILGIVGTVVALPFVQISEPPPGGVPDVMGAMYRGLGVASAVMLGALLLVTIFFDVPDFDDLGHGLSEIRVWLCAVFGVAVTAAMLWITDVYTGDGSKPVDLDELAAAIVDALR